MLESTIRAIGITPKYELCTNKDYKKTKIVQPFYLDNMVTRHKSITYSDWLFIPVSSSLF